MKMASRDDIQQLFEPLLPGLLGIEFTAVTKERVSATMTVRPELCTTGGILHGGSIMAFADTLGAVGTSMNLEPGSGTTTVESSTKFLAAAPVGTTVSAECTAFHRGRTTMVWQTLVRTEAGKLCAVVTQTQLVLNR
jgi:1,4-dihydroxy-2-naphthoyl-CoA hydrolase